MAWAECKATIEAAAGRPFTDDEIRALVDAAEIKLTAKMRRGLSKREATAEAREEISREALLQAMIARRTAYTNKLIWEDLKGQETLGHEARSVVATLSGVAGGSKRGSAASVWARYHAIRDIDFLGPLVNALEKAGVLKLVTSGDVAFNRAVATEMYRLDSPDAIPATGNKWAETAAKLLADANEVARLRLNKAGAWVAKLDNYITRQSHDPFKIGKATQGEWQTYIFDKLDYDKTFGGGTTLPDAMKKLADVYNSLKTGVHDTTGNEVLRAFGGPGSLGKKVSAGRELIFKGPDEWFDYNQRFGKGGVMESVMASLDRAARDVALLERFGTNPEFMFERWVRHLEVQAKDDGGRPVGKGFFGNTKHLGDLFNTVNGYSSLPGNHTIAQVGVFVRDLQQLAKLGQVFFSALPDLVNTAATLRHNGINFWGAMGGQLAALLPSGPGRREAAHTLGVMLDNSAGAMVHRFREGDTITGGMSRAVGVFHKINLLSPWTESMREGVATSLSARLALNANKTFDRLPPMLQSTLRRYGIEEAEWNVARVTKTRALDGVNYIFPSEIADEKVANAFKTYISDQTREALTDPTARVRTILTAGTQAGTLDGEFMRTMTQFKSFSATFMERHLGREFRRDGANIPGIITLAVGLTTAGMASMILKELAAGRAFTWPEDPRQAVALFTKAFLQGGAGGLLADAMLRDPHGYTSGFGEMLLGPTIGSVEDLLKIGYDTAVGDSKDRRSRGEIFAKEAVPFLTQNTPGANMVGLQFAMNYLFIYALQEMVSPGYLRRYERRVEKDGRKFLLRPSESALGLR